MKRCASVQIIFITHFWILHDPSLSALTKLRVYVLPAKNLGLPWSLLFSGRKCWANARAMRDAVKPPPLKSISIWLIMWVMSLSLTQQRISARRARNPQGRLFWIKNKFLYCAQSRFLGKPMYDNLVIDAYPERWGSFLVAFLCLAFALVFICTQTWSVRGQIKICRITRSWFWKTKKNTLIHISTIPCWYRGTSKGSINISIIVGSIYSFLFEK